MPDLLDRLKTALADRYAIEREIGAGGMATVYLAEDLKHHRKVAVKVLRPELAAVVGAERFLQEIQIAANLNHPHILTLIDSGEADGFLYYVMPHVQGEALSDKLSREKQLSIEDALAVARDVGSAISYAHAQGVIHRDLKPGNILLHEGEAMVADFGLALALRAAGGERLTETGLSLGTPEYMSPEQATAEQDVDARSDVYSLGAVLYETLTGEPPHVGASTQATIAKRLTERPTPVRVLRDTVPEGVEQAVTKALAKLPADRFATAADFIEALSKPGGAMPVPRRTWRPSAATLGGVAVAVVAVVLLVQRLAPDPQAALDPTRVFVAAFANETGDASLDYVGKIGADWLMRELQETELIEVVDERAVSFDATETQAGGGDARARTLAQDVGAGTVVSVAYYLLRDSLSFQARITATGTATNLYTATPIISPVESHEGLELLSQDLVGAIVTLFAPGVEWEATGRRPPKPEAYREFIAGMELLPRGDLSNVFGHWFRAAALDTTFITPLLSAVSFMQVAGQYARADSLVSAILQKEGRLRTSERHRLDNLRARLRGNLPEALRAQRNVAKVAPASEATWEVALHELWLNRPREAIETFELLDPTWEFMKNWWFYWMFYCDAYHLLGEHEAELAAARRGRQQYPNELSTVLAEMRALAALGRIDDVNGLLDEAAALPSRPRRNVATLMITVAEELRAHRHRDAADSVLAWAWDWVQTRPADEWASIGRPLAPARILYLSERWEDARDRFVALAAEDSANVNVQGYLGALAARRGDRREARRISAWLESLYPTYLYQYSTVWQARIAALLGDQAEAVRLLGMAFAQGLKHVGTFSTDRPASTWGAWLHRDPDFKSLRNYPPFQQLMRPKG